MTPNSLHGGTVITFNGDLDVSVLKFFDSGWKQVGGDAVVS